MSSAEYACESLIAHEWNRFGSVTKEAKISVTVKPGPIYYCSAVHKLVNYFKQPHVKCPLFLSDSEYFHYI
jgi:hypothetical protein